MAGKGKFERKQEQAITALMSKATVAEAAEVAKIGERTLWRWLQDNSFQELYRQARREAVHQATARLQRICSRAVEALEDVMADDMAPASARVSAAKSVLELAIRAVELEDLENRIEKLEREASKSGP